MKKHVEWGTLNFEPEAKQLTNHKISFTSFINIQDINYNCFGYESFLKSNFSDILALCETIMDNSIDSTNFFLF